MGWLVAGICALALGGGVLALWIMAETADTRYAPDPTYDPSAVKERPDDY